jgi:hypothetical protein
MNMEDSPWVTEIDNNLELLCAVIDEFPECAANKAVEKVLSNSIGQTSRCKDWKRKEEVYRSTMFYVGKCISDMNEDIRARFLARFKPLECGRKELEYFL